MKKVTVFKTFAYKYASYPALTFTIVPLGKRGHQTLTIYRNSYTGKVEQKNWHTYSTISVQKAISSYVKELTQSNDLSMTAITEIKG